MTQYSELIERLRQARALNEYGFIEVHREFLDEAATALSGLVADKQRMDWLVSQHVEVRTPLVYGSRANFVAQQLSDEEDEVHRTDLREQIDRALRALGGRDGE